jgi:hypothetical protein
MSDAIKTEPRYPLSMTGMHGTGKKTLRDGLAPRFELFSAVEYKLLQLGRMVDAEGLVEFRERAREQDRLVREQIGLGSLPITSRLGILDVAITACSMSRLGRIDTAVVDAFVSDLASDLATAAMPESLVATVTAPEVLQERLLARDQQAGGSKARGARPLAGMVALIEEIFLHERYPHTLVERIVRSYRDSGALLIVNTGQRDREEALADVAEFTSRRIAVS